MSFKSISVVTLVVILLFALSGCKPEAEVVEYTKITELEDIPAKVWQNILELNDNRDLQHGVWVFPFGDYYGTENTFVMICGGRAFSGGYDAEITEIKVRMEDTPQVGTDASAYMQPVFSEHDTTGSTAYSVELEYPVVIFRVDSRYGPKDLIESPLDENGPLPVQLNHPTPCEFTKIEDVDAVPTMIKDGLDNLDLRRGVWEFKVPDDEDGSVLYYLVCGGEQFSDGYDVDTLKIKYTPGSGDQVNSGGYWYDAFFTPYIAEESSMTSTPYSQGLSYPVVLFRIDTGFGDHDRITEVVTNEQEVLVVESVGN